MKELNYLSLSMKPLLFEEVYDIFPLVAYNQCLVRNIIVLFEFFDGALEPTDIHEDCSFGFVFSKGVYRVDSRFVFLLSFLNTRHICDHYELNLGIFDHFRVIFEPFLELSRR
jgi:hypothetical protein